MTSTTLTNLGQSSRPQPLLTPAGWVWVVLCVAVFAWMHWYFLQLTARVSADPNWSHVIIVPLISLYYLVQHKDRLAATSKRLCWLALPLIFAGLLSYIIWIYPGRNDMFRGYSMVFTLFAVVLFLLGPAAMRVLWFPVAYLVFAVKISDSIWERIANQLQDVASLGATVMLQVCAVFMDFTVQNNGNTITLNFFRGGQWVSEGMNVAEACSGLRMLMAFVALGVALAFIFDRPWWQRVVMIALAVPIAVAVNIGRVTAIGLIYLYDKSYAQGDFHIFVGLLMLIPAAGLFLLLGWVMDRIIIRDEPEADIRDTPSGGFRAGVAVATGGERQGLSEPALPYILKGLLLGVGLTLALGLVYAMFFNTVAGLPLFPSLGTTASVTLLVVGLMGVGLLGWVAKRVSPKRSGGGSGGALSLTFGAALVVGLMGTAAAGHHSVLSWQKIVLNKQAVPLRRPLTTLPNTKGHWEFFKADELAPEIVEELGTTDYISWWYRDTSMPENTPGSIVRLHVAYYTGLVDTVPHVPDRCFVAGGVEHNGLFDQPIALDPAQFTADPRGGFTAMTAAHRRGYGAALPAVEVHLPDREVTTKRFTFRPPGSDDQHVSYFFIANGKFLSSPNQVRLLGFDFRDKYSYYCKVEVQVVGVDDPAEVQRRTTDVLNAFLPEVLACLPDWREVQAGQWPPPTPGNTPDENTPHADAERSPRSEASGTPASTAAPGAAD